MPRWTLGRTVIALPAMRVALRLAPLVCVAALTIACPPDKNAEPEHLKPPKSWNPKGDELTFGEKNLDAFNGLSESEREAHIEALKGQAGSFKGQARFQRATELGEKMDDFEYGKYEVYATVPDPVLYEITIDYHLFSNEEMGKGFPPGAYVKFSGTLADLSYREDAKPRKLEIKVKDVTLERLED